MTAEVARRTEGEGKAAAGTFLLAALLVGGAAWIGLRLQRDGIAVFWPVAGAFVAIVATAPRGAQRLAALAGALLALGVGNVLIARPLAPSLLFMAANAVQALLIVAVLERAAGGMRFDALRPVVAFLLACAAVAASIGLAVAVALVEIGFAASWRDTWRLWLTSHLVGLLTVAPAVATLRGGSGGLRAMLGARWDEWARVALLVIAAHLMMGWMPEGGGFGTLLSVTVLYALLLWIAVRCEAAVAAVALLLLGVVVVWHARHSGGAMGDDPYPPAILLVAASMWTLTLGALLAQERRTLRAVSESEMRLREAMHVGRAFAFDWDPVTDRVERTDTGGILGPVRIESSAIYFEGIDPRDRVRFERTLAALTPERPSYTVTYRYRLDDGRTIWLEERAHAAFDANGRMTRLRGMSADATERLAAESALREADRAKDRFIATLSHELRNPLAPIRNAAEALRRLAGDDATVARCHHVIDRQLRQMVYLLDELLDVGRISQGKLRLKAQRITLDEVLEQACANVRAQLDEAGQRLETTRPEGEVILDADPVRLVQAIGNLLGNASKYSGHEARIALDASVAPGGARDTLVVAVRDEGVGLSPDDVGRVFGMFTQIEAADGAARGGLGIGLWLVNKIVTLQGGTVSAESAGPGRGATFTIRLPVVVPHRARDGASRPEDASQPSA